MMNPIKRRILYKLLALKLIQGSKTVKRLPGIISKVDQEEFNVFQEYFKSLMDQSNTYLKVLKFCNNLKFYHDLVIFVLFMKDKNKTSFNFMELRSLYDNWDEIIDLIENSERDDVNLDYITEEQKENSYAYRKAILNLLEIYD